MVAAVTHSVSGMSMLAPLVPASTCTSEVGELRRLVFNLAVDFKSNRLLCQF